MASKSGLVPVITLDGPSGTGKGTICHLLAEHLGWHLLDSGAIYRVFAYAVRKNQISFNDIPALTKKAETLNLKFDVRSGGDQAVLLDAEDITFAIRTTQCGQDASELAAVPEVRAALLERQRSFAKEPGLVTDGRDMGTVVFPGALLKVYLYASQEERAKRRYLQLQNMGKDVSLAQVVEEITIRDARDTSRAAAPLKPAEDAELIDTTGLSIVQVLQSILKLLDERMKD